MNPKPDIRSSKRWSAALVYAAAGCVLLVLAGRAPAASLLERLRGLDEPSEGHPVRARLIAEHDAIAPGGATAVGVLFEIEPEWHIYAEDPGDAGLPTTLEWTGPSWAELGPLRWPPHEEFLDAGDIRTRGYAGRVLLSRELKAAPDAPEGGSLPVHAQVDWLACREICLPGSASLDLALPVAAGTPAPGPEASEFTGAVR
ncbi:MAG TPA: protein-disulfide reductase DsbD domain-containing protein [bacterium]